MEQVPKELKNAISMKKLQKYRKVLYEHGNIP